ncbi:MAG: response regulator transcription factor [Archangium sp.]
MKKSRSILVVDDDSDFRERLARALAGRGFDSRTAPDGQTAIAMATSQRPEFATVDLRLPDLSGVDVVRALHSVEVSTRILVLTGYGNIATAVEALRAGAVNYLTKPVDVEQIVAALEQLPAPGAPLPSLEDVEWEHIDRVLTQCEGNLTRAAALLGVHRRSLQRKLRRRPSAL